MTSQSFFPPSFSLHTTNLLFVHVLVQARVEVLPPLKEHRVADELKPRGELEVGLLKQFLELLGCDILCVLNLVGAGVEVDVGLDEKNVVDFLCFEYVSISGLRGSKKGAGNGFLYLLSCSPHFPSLGAL